MNISFFQVRRCVESKQQRPWRRQVRRLILPDPGACPDAAGCVAFTGVRLRMQHGPAGRFPGHHPAGASCSQRSAGAWRRLRAESGPRPGGPRPGRPAAAARSGPAAVHSVTGNKPTSVLNAPAVPCYFRRRVDPAEASQSLVSSPRTSSRCHFPQNRKKRLVSRVRRRR